MFSKLPQKLTSSFGLLGDDSKLAFRTQPDGLRKLTECKNISESDSYWDQYATIFDSASDVFSLISPHDIRRALTESPKNVATLIKVLSSRLFNLISDHTFPSTSTETMTSRATSFIKSGAGFSERNTSKEVLNCLRVLERVLPVVFESENERFEHKLLWEREEAELDAGKEETDEQPHFVIADDEDDEEVESRTPRDSAASTPSEPPELKTLPSLAERLLSCTVDLLFCCGFTLPSKIQVDHYKINYVIWERGVGSTIDPGPNHAHDMNKVEILRFLLVLLSRQIYVSPSSLLSTPSPYTLFFVQQTPRRHVLTVLCSLLNTAMNSTQQPIGVGSVAGKLPYNHLVFKGEDPRVTLVGTCLQSLCVLLDFQGGNARDLLSISTDASSTMPSAKTNAFRYFLAKLHRTADFLFILEGILGILGQHMSSINNLLPGSKRPVPHILETIVFLWKMIELNKKFRSYMLDSAKAVDLLAYLLCYCMEMKDKPQQHGLCRALSYIIQSLSTERSFGGKLVTPINLQLPTKWNTTGTAGDFMINSIYSIVATTSGSLNSLYPALIIALSNTAPYLKNLSVVSSNRLVQLFIAFSVPSFLLSDEGHPRLLFFMLEVFNGILLHHPQDNPNLIYAILRSHKVFEDLGTFTLAGGLREVRRVQVAKEEQLKKTQGAVKGKDASTERNIEDPHMEKARLLRAENQNSQDVLPGLELDETSTPTQLSPGARRSLEDSHELEDILSGQPLMSPTIPQTPGDAAESVQNTSEKARGKMRERPRSLSVDTTSSLERIAAAGVGRNGFVPTQEWVTSWQQGLPLDTILLAISELLPKVHDLQLTLNKTNNTTAVIDYLCSVTLQHVLPTPGPVMSRRFLWSDSSIIWLTSLIWGEIYVRGMSPLGIWNFTNVRLFYVKHTQTQPLQISEAVSHVVGGIGGLLGRSNSESQVARPSRNAR